MDKKCCSTPCRPACLINLELDASWPCQTRSCAFRGHSPSTCSSGGSCQRGPQMLGATLLVASAPVPCRAGQQHWSNCPGHSADIVTTHPASAGHVAGCLCDCHCCLCKDPTTAVLTMPRWPCRSACSKQAVQRLHSEALTASRCSRPCMSSALAGSSCSKPATDCPTALYKTASAQEYRSVSKKTQQIVTDVAD